MTALTIRAREPSDAAAIAALMNLPGVRHGTLRVPFVTKSFVETWATGPTNTCLLAVRHDTIIGVTVLMQGRDRTAHTGLILLFVHDAHINTGVGTALLTEVLNLADHVHGLRRVSLTVNADNRSAIHLYRKFGFETEGILRGDVLRDGVFIDSLTMARLRF
jgi:putative acetyltransferase